MPTEHTKLSYTYEELDADAQRKAVEAIAEKLSGEWWDENDIEQVGETIVYALAEAFKTPGWDTFGEGDFPGIDGVSVKEWDLDRGEMISADGLIGPGNAPGLTWPTAVSYVELNGKHHGTSINVVPVDYLRFVCSRCGNDAGVDTSWSTVVVHLTDDGLEDSDLDNDHKPFLVGGNLPSLDSSILDSFEQVVRDCLSSAITAGRKAMEYIGSEENASEWILHNEPEFNLDGTVF